MGRAKRSRLKRFRESFFGVPARAPPDWMLGFSESVRQERNGDGEMGDKSNAACKQQTAVMAGKRAPVW